MAAARTQTKRKKAPPARAKRSLMASRPSLRGALELEPHQVDVLALALIAVGIFLGGVAYLHWGGGTLGDGAVRAARFLLGAVGYVVPAALVLTGALILARDWRPPIRPLRTGTLCMTFALTLALAAGTLGIGPGRRVSYPSYWHPVGIRGARRNRRPGRVLGDLTPALDRRRRHPRRVHAAGRRDPADGRHARIGGPWRAQPRIHRNRRAAPLRQRSGARDLGDQALDPCGARDRSREVARMSNSTIRRSFPSRRPTS